MTVKNTSSDKSKPIVSKKAYLWVWFWPDHVRHGGHCNADLVFSSRAKFLEVVGHPYENDQLVEIQVPEWFDNWDYVPDNY